jgi:Flp pilus assembly protein TadB
MRREADSVACDLPIAVDLVGVAVAAGCTPYLAVSCASKWSPPSVAVWLDRVHESQRFGRSFGEALESVGSTQPVLRALCEVLETSNRLGSPAGAALTDLSTRLRADVRRRAEARARSLSVRLVFPLVFLVLPAFALLTVAPAVISGFRAATA